MAKPSGIIATSERVETARGCVDGRQEARREVAQNDEADRGEREKRPGVEALQAGPHDQQHREEADPDRGPAADADRLAEHERRDGGRGERHDLEDRGGIGDLEVGQRGQVDCRRADLTDRAKRDEALRHLSRAGRRRR